MADISKRSLKWIIASVVVAAVAFIGVRWWITSQSELPEGIASGNGRLEAKLVDVAAKEPLRVREILVDEGANHRLEARVHVQAAHQVPDMVSHGLQ